jgi:hypothetical protein
MSSSQTHPDPAPHSVPASNTDLDGIARILQTVLSRLDGLESKVTSRNNTNTDPEGNVVDPPLFPPTTPADSTTDPASVDFLDPRDWLDYLPVEYVDDLPPIGSTRPALWTPRNDPADAFFTSHNRLASRDEYRHLLCYGLYNEVALAALTSGLASLRQATPADADSTPWRLIEAAVRTLRTTTDAGTIRVAYLRRFKAKAQLPPDLQVEERYLYSRFFAAPPRAEGQIALDTLHRAFDDKRLELGLHAAAKSSVAAQFRTDMPRPDARSGPLKARPLRPTGPPASKPSHPRDSSRPAPPRSD